MKFLGFLICGLLLSNAACGADPVDYAKQIKPVLQARCYACHGVLKQAAALRLDTAALAIKGGDSGEAIEPGDAAGSLLLERISASDEADRMPPEGEPLKPEEIAAFKAWIAQGAKAPLDEKPEGDPRDHWAFKSPVRPAVPVVENSAWIKNPVDAFIAAEHRKRGLQPQPAASKQVWLRRVSLDLVGLPPTRDELAAFLADESPAAHDTVVTRLLDSPQYGERWGRHWMDIWRYSDWWGLGAEVRNSQKHIWHWRDWIIESLNADKGYDQMLREMLAADELYPNDLDRLRASGFLARQYFKFNRTTWMDETVEHTAKAMLGLTFNCAKCHDHKYDPVSHVEYHRMRAFFEPYQIRTDAVPGEVDLELDGIPRAYDCNLEAQTFLLIRGDDRNPDKDRLIEPIVPAFLALRETKIEPVALPVEAYQPGLRTFVVDSHTQAAERKIAAVRAALAEAQKRLTESEQAAEISATKLAEVKQAAAVAQYALVTADAQAASLAARVAADRARYLQPPGDSLALLVTTAVRLERIATAAKADEDVAIAELELLQAAAEKRSDVEKKVTAAKAVQDTVRKAIDMPGESYTSLPGALKTLESNLETEDSRRKPFPQTSTGRRSALAKWITDPRHPLPARVAVNHLWSRHFGRALVPTVFDFGRKGTPPTHPELVDWLAVELIEHGWSMKHIHRLIVTSNTYRMTSSSAQVAAETLAADPDNHFLWRTNPIRMEAQLIRDSLLHLAGELDLTRGGPPIPVNNETSRRRSLYFVHSHNEHQKFLSMFDDANVLECYRRSESIVPQQALALENSPLATAMAEKIMQRIAATHSSDTDFIRAAFLTILAAEPTDAEHATVIDALGRLTAAAQTQNRPNPDLQARTNLIQALINHNDFVTVR